MDIKLAILLLTLSFFACEGDRSDSPVLPEVLEVSGDDAKPEPSGDEESPDIDNGSSTETPADTDDEGNNEDGDEGADKDKTPDEGTRLNVVSLDQLPQRIAECVQQGLAGEVINNVFTCNQQELIDCNSLSEAQKRVAKAYADEELPGYSLYGCSRDADDDPNLHYYMVEGVSLKIFNLKIQRSEALN